MPEPVEILRGRDIVVDTKSVRKGLDEWDVSTLTDLQIRMLEGRESAGFQTFLLGLTIAALGLVVSGPIGFGIGLFVLLLSPWVHRREAITFLLVGPQSDEGDLLVIYSNHDRRQVEKLKQAIEIAQSWPPKEEELGRVPQTGD